MAPRSFHDLLLSHRGHLDFAIFAPVISGWDRTFPPRTRSRATT
jgi:hypothetical protein